MISNYRGEEFSGLDLLSTLYQRDRLRRFLTDLSSHYPAHLTEFVWFEVGFHDMIENSCKYLPFIELCRNSVCKEIKNITFLNPEPTTQDNFYYSMTPTRLFLYFSTENCES